MHIGVFITTEQQNLKIKNYGIKILQITNPVELCTPCDVTKQQNMYEPSWVLFDNGDDR